MNQNDVSEAQPNTMRNFNKHIVFSTRTMYLSNDRQWAKRQTLFGVNVKGYEAYNRSMPLTKGDRREESVSKYQPKIKWLNGAAGAGKSSIAQTVTVCCAKEGTLGARFFIKRLEGRHGIAKHLVATLTHKLCETIPGAGSLIEAAVDSDPTFLSCSLPTQFTKLIIKPLNAIVLDPIKPVLIVIDGLDECDDPKIQAHIIHLLAEICRDFPSIPFRFLVASGPEYHIRSAFSSLASPSPFSERNLQHRSFNADKDTRLYLDATIEIIRTK
ncbi:hypothetical protein BJ165DRAFT_1533701 [Panaeolus papilionaceus]|nr:hypothetical protein BJ165DRAFT_1533701 [Panaeolus papilionaceus]